jgi:hypothetical protein
MRWGTQAILCPKGSLKRRRRLSYCTCDSFAIENPCLQVEKQIDFRDENPVDPVGAGLADIRLQGRIGAIFPFSILVEIHRST